MQDQHLSDFAARLFGKTSGQLGFGTGLLHQVKSASNSVRLLREAQEQGVTYFDTARLYADGQAEGLIGEAFSHIRDNVIIVTKVGILPIARDSATRIKAKATTLLRRVSPLRSIVPPPAVQHPEFGVFDRKRMQESFETSLRMLRTEYVDALLLHECSLDNLRSEEVQRFLEEVVREGKARTSGVAPTANDMLSIAASGTPYGEIAQFDASIRGRFPPVGAEKAPLVVTHSCLGQRYRAMVNRLKEDVSLRDAWASGTGTDPADASQVAQAFLAHALIQNPDGVVLFSTTQPERLKANLKAAEWPKVPDKRAAVMKLMSEVSGD